MCSKHRFQKNLLGRAIARRGQGRLPAGGVKRDKNKEDFTSFFSLELQALQK
jgi:hypothetical protein